MEISLSHAIPFGGGGFQNLHLTAGNSIVACLCPTTCVLFVLIRNVWFESRSKSRWTPAPNSASAQVEMKGLHLNCTCKDQIAMESRYGLWMLVQIHQGQTLIAVLKSEGEFRVLTTSLEVWVQSFLDPIHLNTCPSLL